MRSPFTRNCTDDINRQLKLGRKNSPHRSHRPHISYQGQPRKPRAKVGVHEVQSPAIVLPVWRP